jgi:hypothetical protein
MRAPVVTLWEQKLRDARIYKGFFSLPTLFCSIIELEKTALTYLADSTRSFEVGTAASSPQCGNVKKSALRNFSERPIDAPTPL